MKLLTILTAHRFPAHFPMMQKHPSDSCLRGIPFSCLRERSETCERAEKSVFPEIKSFLRPRSVTQSFIYSSNDRRRQRKEEGGGRREENYALRATNEGGNAIALYKNGARECEGGKERVSSPSALYRTGQTRVVYDPVRADFELRRIFAVTWRCQNDSGNGWGRTRGAK